jgi:PAS domain S-box-containing protein
MQIPPSELSEQLSTERSDFPARLPDGLPLRPLIRQSWQRCRSAGIDRDPTPLHRVSDDELRRRLEHDAELLPLVRSHLEWLSATLTAVPHVLYFADRDGIVLDSAGNAPDLLREGGLTPGYDRSEARMGTNGAGTALVTGSPVAVIGPEHYARAFQGCTCTAAPLHGPAGELLGAIDLTTPNLPDAPGRLALVAYAAHAIERELAARRAIRDDEGEVWLRLASSNGEYGVWELDMAKGLARWNARAQEIFGRRIDGPIPLAEAFAVIHPDDRALAERAYTAILEGGGDDIYRVEKRILWPDGSVRWISTRGRVLPGKGGEPLGSRMLGTVADITERKLGEASMRENQDRLRRIAESGMVGVIYWDLTGAITFANDYFLELTGYDREDLAAGRIDWRAMTPPEWHAADAAAVEEVARTGVSRPFEKEYLRTDGSRVPVLLSAAAFRGTMEHGVTLVLDLSEQKRTKVELQESRRVLEWQLRVTRTITDNATAALILMDPAGRGIVWNPAWEEMTGFRAEELKGKVLHDLIHHTRPDGTPFPVEECPIDRALPDGIEVRGYEDVFVRRDGSFFPVSCAAQPIREDGVPVATVVEVRDLTEQKHAEEALRRSEERFRATFEQAAVGVAHVDLDGRWLRVNARLCEIVGYRRDEFQRLTFQEITHPDDLDRDLALVQRLLAGEIEHYSMEKRYLRPDGTHVWVNLTVSLVRTPEGAPEHFIAVVEDIRQRKEVEARLVASERHLRAVIDSMFAFVGVMTPDGILVEANRAALQAAGLRPDDVLGRPFPETYWWSHDPAVQRQLRDAIERAAAGEPSRYDVVIRLGPDRFVPIDFMLSPLRDEQGRITHLVPSAIVIVERVAAEKALRESEARLRTALAAARMGTWDIDLASGEVHRSESTDVLFGLPATGERRTADEFFERVHPGDVRRVQESIARSLDEGLEHRVEYRIVQPDGSERWVISRGEIIRDEEGRPIRLVGALADETARHRAEAALRESEQRFRTLADNIPQLAWMADAGGSIFWYNHRWFEYTGTTLEQMEGWGWQSLHQPEWVEGVSARFRAAVEAEEPWEDTFPLRGADGEYRWFLSRALPIRDDEGRVVRWFGTNTDITAQREAAAERERLYHEARAASQAKSDFMAVMSHELRTPLNAILGYADLLELGMAGPLADRARSYVERIRLSADHQKQLIEDVLTFSRIEAGREVVEVQHVVISELLREITAVIVPLAERKALKLFTDTVDAPESMRTDGRKLRQILVNLLGNAVKFTTEGHVALCIEQTEHCVCFVVEDTGIGVDAEHLERLFEPFWQGDHSLTRTAEGTGLGLSISHRFAQLLGGDIQVESVPGQGSTFTLVLPRDLQDSRGEACREESGSERRVRIERRAGRDRRLAE